MVKVTLDHAENNFYNIDTSPWAEERRLFEGFFRIPSLRLTAAIFGTSYSPMELPYWYFKADARRHALYCIRSGKDDSGEIFKDYEQRIFIPSQATILGEGVYDSMINDVIDGLPPSGRSVSYSQVIRGRFGFDGRPKGIETLAKEFRKANLLIKDIEDNALRIMRNPSRSDRIKHYLDGKRLQFFKYLYEAGLVEREKS